MLCQGVGACEHVTNCQGKKWGLVCSFPCNTILSNTTEPDLTKSNANHAKTNCEQILKTFFSNENRTYGKARFAIQICNLWYK
jgi:hypothetical protein